MLSVSRFFWIRRNNPSTMKRFFLGVSTTMLVTSPSSLSRVARRCSVVFLTPGKVIAPHGTDSLSSAPGPILTSMNCGRCVPKKLCSVLPIVNPNAVRMALAVARAPSHGR